MLLRFAADNVWLILTSLWLYDIINLGETGRGVGSWEDREVERSKVA
jgi:hypothetical protein